MFPVIFSIGKISISSFGILLALGFLFGMFLIWRLSRAWDLDEEKVLDLTLFTFLGGFLGSRIYFALNYPQLFENNLLGILFINKIPGFSFWGALLGGWLTLFFASRRKKMDFSQVGDIASVGFIGSLIFTNLGCFFGGCGVGVVSKLFFAVPMVATVGRRFPTQLLEAILLSLALWSLWSLATHFHTRGKILSLSLIYLGLIRFLIEPLRQSHDLTASILSFVLFCLGVTMLYKVTRRNILKDVEGFFANIGKFVTEGQAREQTFVGFKKSWYNKKTLLFWKLRNFKKVLKRKNVRFS
jgi:phosphatidylglycerol---prolipoprotein diacylglyceryl transferase